MTRPASAGLLLSISVLATVVLVAGCGSATREESAATSVPSLTATAPARLVPHLPETRPSDPPVPGALYPAGLDVREEPVPVPLQLQIPSIGVSAQVLGVGVTPDNVMDAPEGPINDPVWGEAFWYRGSAVPGVLSTSVIAGHINGPRGSPGVFGHIDRLHKGDLIVAHDTRSALDVRFQVIGSTSFTLEQAKQPDVLRQIYGVGPVAGTTPQRAEDGLAHLTLVTCAGTFERSLGTHDHRLAVFAIRVA